MLVRLCHLVTHSGGLLEPGGGRRERGGREGGTCLMVAVVGDSRGVVFRQKPLLLLEPGVHVLVVLEHH